MKKFKAIAAVALAAALAMGTVTGAGAAGKTLTLGSIAKPISFAADKAEYGNRAWYYQAIYDTLMIKTEDGTLKPSLATKWVYNKTQTQLTLTLRTDAKFTNGTPVNAAAVAKNLIANRDGNGPTANYLAAVKTVVAKGDTVVLTLKDVDPALLEYLADSAGTIAAPTTIGKASAATDPIGSGPYILDKAKTRAGSKYVFKSNPNYWNKANRKYDNLVISVYEDITAMSNALKSGAVQGGNVFPETVAPVKASGFKFAQGYLDVKGIYFSARTNPKSCVSDVNVRRAINTVFDRAAMLSSLDNGFGKVTTQYVNSSSKGYDVALNKKYAYSVDAAKALMAKSAFASGCTISMATFTPVFGEAGYSIIRSQLGKIGITVTEVEEAGGTFIANIMAPKYDAYLMIFERAGNPWKMLNFMITSNGTFNNDGYAEPTVTKLIESFKTAAESKKPAILKAINTELVNNAWFAPWYEIQGNFAYKGIVVKSAQAGNATPYLYNIK
jgi:peptide/nickel transport system substrate-binding protein